MPPPEEILSTPPPEEVLSMPPPEEVLSMPPPEEGGRGVGKGTSFKGILRCAQDERAPCFPS